MCSLIIHLRNFDSTQITGGGGAVFCLRSQAKKGPGTAALELGMATCKVPAGTTEGTHEIILELRSMM